MKKGLKMFNVECPFCNKENEIEIELSDCLDCISTTEEIDCEYCSGSFSFDLSVDLDVSLYNIIKVKSGSDEEEDFFEDKHTMRLF